MTRPAAALLLALAATPCVAPDSLQPRSDFLVWVETDDGRPGGGYWRSTMPGEWPYLRIKEVPDAE